MIGSLRKFSKSKFAAVFIFIVCIPFVFWGMGDVFSSGNTNNIAKINEKNISTEDFLNHINTLEISPEYIRDNLDKNREFSPMVPAKDAFLLDTSNLTVEEALKKIIVIISQKFKK